MATMANRQEGRPLFKCGICDKSFAHHDCLKRHGQSHNPLFVCSHCPARFDDRGDLKLHEELHKGNAKAIRGVLNLFNTLPSEYSVSLDQNNKPRLTLLGDIKEMEPLAVGTASDLEKEAISKFVPELAKKESFKALLIDAITDPLMSWERACELMKKDERWQACESLDKDVRKSLFEEHIASILVGQQRQNFYELLNSVPDLHLDLSSEWKAIEKRLKTEPEYVENDLNREWFKQLIAKKISDAKNDFKRLLDERFPSTS